MPERVSMLGSTLHARVCEHAWQYFTAPFLHLRWRGAGSVLHELFEKKKLGLKLLHKCECAVCVTSLGPQSNERKECACVFTMSERGTAELSDDLI